MSQKNSPWSLPDKTVEHAEEADREIRMSDFLLMGILPFRSSELAGFPLNEFAMAALFLLCLMRPARGGARLPSTVVVLAASLFTLLLGSGIANDIDWMRRMGHLGITLGVMWAAGTGRISLRSAGRGLATSLVAIVVLALAGIGGNYYPGRLTGFLADPNAAAYYLAVLGVVAIFFCDERTKVRVAVAIPIVAGLGLTLSRTGLLAGAFALVWIFVGRRMGQVAGALLAVGMVWVVNNIPESLTTIGPFSDRSGSDNLRERIIAQERVEIASAPWYGHGPGTGKVHIRDLEFFFHNSYLSTRQEGGWGALLLVLALMAYAFIKLAQQSYGGDLKASAVQAALISTAVMAVTLGEVLLDTPIGVVVGIALGQALHAKPESPPDG